MPAPTLLRIPAWLQYSWLHAAFSTRPGGQSTIYGVADLNLGFTPNDDPANVAANRTTLIAEVSPGFELVTLAQVHSATTLRIAATTPHATPDGRPTLRGDGLCTRQPGLLLGIQTADCVPVLVADTRTHAVAAFHAGWRGTSAQIVEQGIAMLEREGSHPDDLIAAIGPAIAVCCYSVGDEVHANFHDRFPYGSSLFISHGQQPHFDLHEANRRQLLAAGLHPDAITVLAECTACTRLPNGQRRYFSHRVEHGVTGRMMGVIGTT